MLTLEEKDRPTTRELIKHPLIWENVLFMVNKQFNINEEIKAQLTALEIRWDLLMPVTPNPLIPTIAKGDQLLPNSIKTSNDATNAIEQQHFSQLRLHTLSNDPVTELLQEYEQRDPESYAFWNKYCTEQIRPGTSISTSASVVVTTIMIPNERIGSKDFQGRYSGTTKNGLKHGRGYEYLRSHNGDSVFFHCFYEFGKRIKGTQVTRIGKETLYCYTGTFSSTTSLYEGKGVLHNFKGHTYTGEFKAGLKDGDGLYKTDKGSYQGGFSEGIKHGKGTQTMNDGRVLSGEWRNGEKIGSN
jgi:hypothetical protein